jgi:hypothetical protein
MQAVKKTGQRFLAVLKVNVVREYKIVLKKKLHPQSLNLVFIKNEA